MTGSCIIDGIDLSSLGVFILRGGDLDFISYPERKAPLSTSWYEQNGIDVDLTEIYFKEKQVSVKFHLQAGNGTEMVSRIASFRSLLSAPGLRRIYVREFDKTFLLRYVSCPDYSHRGGLAKKGGKRGDITVTFSMDDPLQFFTHPEITHPAGSWNNKTYVTIGGRDLGEFGIIVTQCYNSLLLFPALKRPLTRSFDKENGLLVSTPATANYEVKQVTISCVMRATDLTEFYNNYEALFNVLTVKEELSLSSYAGTETCFYSSMSNFRKLRPFKSRVLVSFDLILTCLDSGAVAFLLAAEDGSLFVTEDGMYFIDMAYYGHN